MRAMTGRAVSAAIHQSLKDALLKGEPLTYQQLADHAGCTVRSVRNYLARAEDIFGFPIQKSRDEDHRVLVRAVGVPPSTALDAACTDPFADAFAASLFPHTASSNNGAVIVALRGFPNYGPHQARVAKTWAQTRNSHANTALTLH